MLIGIFYSDIVESSSLVSVLFREAISHPYIFFFHLLVNGFSVVIIISKSLLVITIPPRSACKCSKFLYQLVAIQMKYVLLVLIIRLLKYLGL